METVVAELTSEGTLLFYSTDVFQPLKIIPFAKIIYTSQFNLRRGFSVKLRP